MGTEQANSVTKSIEAGFEAKFPFGLGSAYFKGSVSRSMSSRTSTSVSRTREAERTQTFHLENGRYLWTWVWTANFREVSNTIYTNFKVQSDTRPRCLPGGQADGQYQHCIEGMCLERCETSELLQVGDYVLHTPTNRGGQIKRKDVTGT